MYGTYDICLLQVSLTKIVKMPYVCECGMNVASQEFVERGRDYTMSVITHLLLMKAPRADCW